MVTLPLITGFEGHSMLRAPLALCFLISGHCSAGDFFAPLLGALHRRYYVITLLLHTDLELRREGYCIRTWSTGYCRVCTIWHGHPSMSLLLVDKHASVANHAGVSLCERYLSYGRYGACELPGFTTFIGSSS